MAQAIQECSATDKRAPTVTNVMAIVVAGMTKVFVGEITAEGAWANDERAACGGTQRIDVVCFLVAGSAEDHGNERRDGTHSSTSSSRSASQVLQASAIGAGSQHAASASVDTQRYGQRCNVCCHK